MKRTTPFRVIALAAALVAALAGAFPFLADAQSEFMRGNRMPYDAFERLPKTDLEISGGIIHVAFAPGEIALPKEKVLDWVRTSAKAVATYYGRFPVNAAEAADRAGRRPARSRRHHLGLIAARRSACCSAAIPAKTICGATG